MRLTCDRAHTRGTLRNRPSARPCAPARTGPGNIVRRIQSKTEQMSCRPPRPRYTPGVDQLASCPSKGFLMGTQPAFRSSRRPTVCTTEGQRRRRGGRGVRGGRGGPVAVLSVRDRDPSRASRTRIEGPKSSASRPEGPTAACTGAHAMARGSFCEVPPHAHAATPRRRAPEPMMHHGTMSRHRACRTREGPWQCAASSPRSGSVRRICE
jgi:hypothetical protein